jgi:hypothetical protein
MCAHRPLQRRRHATDLNHAARGTHVDRCGPTTKSIRIRPAGPEIFRTRKRQVAGGIGHASSPWTHATERPRRVQVSASSKRARGTEMLTPANPEITPVTRTCVPAGATTRSSRITPAGSGTSIRLTRAPARVVTSQLPERPVVGTPPATPDQATNTAAAINAPRRILRMRSIRISPTDRSLLTNASSCAAMALALGQLGTGHYNRTAMTSFDTEKRTPSTAPEAETRLTLLETIPSSDPCAAHLFGAVFKGSPVSSASLAAILELGCPPRPLLSDRQRGCVQEVGAADLDHLHPLNSLRLAQFTSTPSETVAP